MKKERRKLLNQVAYMYYVEEKNQNEIATELNIYRTTISRMIKQARESGIVEITIKGFDTHMYQLENHLRNAYDLRFIHIVPTKEEESEEERYERFVKEASHYVSQVIEPDSIVGVSWGRALGDTIGHIESKRTTNATFVPLVGGPSFVNAKYHVNTLVYELARKLGGKSIFVNAAAVQETVELKEGIMQSQYFTSLKDYWAQLDTAIVGIGGRLSDKKSSWRDFLTKEDYEELRLREAVGDCCCRFFDKYGKVLRGDQYNRTIGIELESLRGVPTVLGVAGGKGRSRAILTCLENKFINALITDERTALELIKFSNASTTNVLPEKE